MGTRSLPCVDLETGQCERQMDLTSTAFLKQRMKRSNVISLRLIEVFLRVGITQQNTICSQLEGQAVGFNPICPEQGSFLN